ncbi:hypothetical protein GSI_08879 [Ganoderma sinense ZZ0214-1]|uniref:Uncharacterized protein n=1 Tax=Ganoderma sinense ZZ0214-1 TaxID=1077348 RepID=A0A2G8S527_9APHY|nr:hypothetical protein GSI_08879 [Ganoderma sinense ZZ0214-1]
MSQPIPPGADPRMFWNGQYLLEDDPENPLSYSKAAQEAQRAKWLKLVENRPPLKKLPREMIAKDGSKPPLYYHYGIPFTDQYMFEYAKRHHIALKLSPETSKYFDGSPVLDYSKLTPEQEQDAELMSQLRGAAGLLAVEHIQERCNITLHIARPFSLEWDGMVSLFSNFNFHDRYSRLIGSPERFKRIVAKLKEAMYEGGQENDIEWWYEWDNPVGVFTSLE